LNNFAKEIKKVSGKKKKTDADLERMAELEFKGSLYVNEEKRPIMPLEGIEAVVVAGARKTKEGQVAKAGLFCSENSILEYDGPKDPDKLWENESFRLRVPVKINQSKVIRTRPIFKQWSCVVELSYNPTICNEEQIFSWLKVAGEQCGAFDWRPKYGRFSVEKV
jgi:hypothetical protein